VLAKTTQAAALATTPRVSSARYKHLELVGIHGCKVLLILVLQQGVVKQHLLDLDAPLEQEELSRTSNELNAKLAGVSVGDISTHFDALSPFARQIALIVSEIMEHVDRQAGRQIYRDGLAQILDAPEFAEGETIRRIVQVFEEQSVLEQVVEEYRDVDDIQILISGDGRFAELSNISLVLARYGVIDQATGLVGVIGPLRMSYGRTVGVVRYVATVMSEVVEDLYGSQ
jgi:heat-inducible transcriptional repressor